MFRRGLVLMGLLAMSFGAQAFNDVQNKRFNDGVTFVSGDEARSVSQYRRQLDSNQDVIYDFDFHHELANWPVNFPADCPQPSRDIVRICVGTIYGGMALNTWDLGEVREVESLERMDRMVFIDFAKMIKDYSRASGKGPYPVRQLRDAVVEAVTVHAVSANSDWMSWWAPRYLNKVYSEVDLVKFADGNRRGLRAEQLGRSKMISGSPKRAERNATREYNFRAANGHKLFELGLAVSGFHTKLTYIDIQLESRRGGGGRDHDDSTDRDDRSDRDDRNDRRGRRGRRGR